MTENLGAPENSLLLPLKASGDTERAVRELRLFSGATGFDREAVEELALVVTELATNGLKYGGGRATIEFTRFRDERNEGLKIVYLAPGEQKPALAAACSGGLGLGLDIVRNHVDSFALEPEGGLRITATKNLPVSGKPLLTAEISVISTPALGETANGDGYHVDRMGHRLHLAVWDVLGHGEGAQEVSRKAKKVFVGRRGWDLETLFSRCQAALLGTRGMAVATMILDLFTGEGFYTGVGNVETRFVSKDQRLSLAPRPGIVGKAGQTAKVQKFLIESSGVLIMASDGISLRHLEEDVKKAGTCKPWTLAEFFVTERARQADDKTVLAAMIRKN